VAQQEALHDDDNDNDNDGGDDDAPSRAPKGQRKKKNFDFPFAYHEELIVTIESLTNTGNGVARVPVTDKDGTTTNWVVFVPLSLPDETVRIRVFRNLATYSEADVVEVITASKDRVQPLCVYFQDCGGCQYQHLALPAQRNWKQAQVRELLQRIGKFGDDDVVVNAVVGTDESYGYRSKITPHYEPPRSNKGVTIGFQKRGTRQVVSDASFFGYFKRLSFMCPWTPGRRGAMRHSSRRHQRQVRRDPNPRQPGRRCAAKEATRRNVIISRVRRRCGNEPTQCRYAKGGQLGLQSKGWGVFPGPSFPEQTKSTRFLLFHSSSSR